MLIALIVSFSLAVFAGIVRFHMSKSTLRVLTILLFYLSVAAFFTLLFAYIVTHTPPIPNVSKLLM